MIKVNDFQQIRMFERVDEILHPKNKARLDADWPGLFRSVFLQMMPVDDLGEGFSSDFGRPTKEHYSMCGLILLKDYFGWTTKETVDEYLYNLKIHYALRIESDNLELSIRTLERYLKIFRKKKLAQDLMDRVTRKIISELNIKIDKQRLDSSHVFSNMADWSRSMLLFKTTKRFLVQVKRHENKLYNERDEEFSERYRFRNGTEGLFGNQKQYTPLRRLGVRGEEAVYNAIYSIMTVHNLCKWPNASKIHQRK